MPIEIIGDFGTAGADPEWLGAQGKLAVKHLKKICGDPPPEMELEIVWREHDYGNYPVIGLVWEGPMRGAPWNYIARCEAALTAYENDGELPPEWTTPPVSSDDDHESDDVSLDLETPPDPPETLNLFELQRYISKLKDWGLKTSALRRQSPHLVESDDDRSDEP